MSTIYKTDSKYNFNSLKLHNPKGLQGGAFFSKLLFDNEPVLIQTPKCLTKDGIHKTEKRIYCDLKFDDSKDIFFTWIKHLEEKIQSLIYEKKDLWFHNDMDIDSIEYHWQSLLRTYKRNFQLLRTFVQKPKSFDSAKLIQIYDEQENSLTLDDIKQDTEVIAILEITGLKFTSQSFCLEFYLRQVMVLKNKPLFNKCLISLSDDKDLESKIEPMKIQLKDNLDKPLDNKKNITDLEKNNSLETKPNITQDITNTNDTQSKNTDKNDKNTDENITQNTDNINLVISDNSNNSTNNNSEDNTNELIDTNNDVHDVTNELTHTTNNKTDNTNEEKTDISANSDNKPIINDDKFKEDVADEIKSIEKSLENDNILSEIDIELPKKENIIKLKPANEVYIEIYKEARKRAKDAKRQAIKSYLEAKRIKSTYLLDDIESSDDDLEDYADLFN